MKVYIGTDHRGVETQNKIVNYLKDLGIDINISKLKHNDNDDYPDFAFDVCKRVVDNKNSLGILICGTGIGMSIALNKMKGIYCAKVSNESEAILCKAHNNVNCIAISEELDEDLMLDIVDKFINTPFTNVSKYIRRNDMIKELEK